MPLVRLFLFLLYSFIVLYIVSDLFCLMSCFFIICADDKVPFFFVFSYGFIVQIFSFFIF